MSYIDANVFVYACAGEEPFRAAASKALRKALKAGAVTSALTMDEIVWALRPQGIPFAVAQARRILAFPGLRVLAVTGDHVGRALALVEKGLRPRDAIHAVMAMTAQTDILSFDSDFDDVPGLRRKAP